MLYREACADAHIDALPQQQRGIAMVRDVAVFPRGFFHTMERGLELYR